MNIEKDKIGSILIIIGAIFIIIVLSYVTLRYLGILAFIFIMGLILICIGGIINTFKEGGNYNG